jgi:8-oxo-dGTP diphosphatase
MKNDRPLVGVGVIIIKNKKVLLLKRLHSHGDGTWAFIGGHLEFNESLEDCAKREVFEEIGVKIKNIKPVAFTNDFFSKENKHYVTLFLTAEIESGVEKNMEIEKASEIKWFSWDKLPTPLFTPIKNLLKQNFNPIS